MLHDTCQFYIFSLKIATILRDCHVWGIINRTIMQKIFSILSFFFIGLIIFVGLLPGSVFANDGSDQTPIASKINQNLHSILVNPGSSIDFVVNFQNIGQQSWHKYRLITKHKTSISNNSTPFF
jgi:hypothetical protein